MGGGTSKPKEEEEAATAPASDQTKKDQQQQASAEPSSTNSQAVDDAQNKPVDESKGPESGSEQGPGTQGATKDPLIVLLFGKPGAGKGTHSPHIVSSLGISALSTGDMLRGAVERGTDVGKECKEIMNAGGLVSDELVMKVVSDATADNPQGYILDGFPRTVEQNNLLQQDLGKKGHTVSAVVYFQVEDSALEKRIVGRWIHSASGRSYHVDNAKPKSLIAAGEGAEPSVENMLDDETGDPLKRRKDDTAEALKERLKQYYAETAPILEFYKEKGLVHEIDCDQTIEQVHSSLDEVVSKIGK